jgi:SAM-dependent methyltransferase
MTPLRPIAGAALAVWIVACRSAGETGAPPLPPCSDLAPAPERANRDLHGPSDVAGYVDALESAARVAELRVDATVAALAPAPDAVVADLGCGPGVFALAFARAAPQGLVFAVDVEPAQLDRLREHLAETGLENVVPVLASQADPHLPNGGCDLVFIADTYHHIDDRVAYFARLRRDLAPGGRLAVLEYLPGDIPVGPPAEHKLAAGVRERELVEAGWTRIAAPDLHEWHELEVWQIAAGSP